MTIDDIGAVLLVLVMLSGFAALMFYGRGEKQRLKDLKRRMVEALPQMGHIVAREARQFSSNEGAKTWTRVYLTLELRDDGNRRVKTEVSVLDVILLETLQVGSPFRVRIDQEDPTVAYPDEPWVPREWWWDRF